MLFKGIMALVGMFLIWVFVFNGDEYMKSNYNIDVAQTLEDKRTEYNNLDKEAIKKDVGDSFDLIKKNAGSIVSDYVK